MKKTKALIAGVLTAATLLSACGSTASTTGSTAASAAAPTETLESIRFMTKDYYTCPEMAEKMSDIFLTDTGVTLDIQHIPNNNWEEKVTASFVSGDMPDIVRLPENPYAFVKQDFLVPLDDYIAASPDVKAILEANPEAIKPFQYFDKTYAISINNQKYMTLWMRTDWLKTLGKEMPTNMDELLDVLRDFRDKDLDGNGKNDTVPLTLPSVLQTQDMFANYFGTRNEVYMENGKGVVPFLTEEYKEYMDFIKMMYDEKLLDLEMPTNTSMGAVRTKFNTGVAGSIIMWDDIYATLFNNLQTNGFADADVAYVPSFKGDKGTFGLSYFQADSPIGITAACENPQETFDKFFSWYLASENGILTTSLGVDGYNFDVVDGKMVPNPDNGGGAGFHGQSIPPIDRSFVYPFGFDEIWQTKYDNIVAISENGKTLGATVNAEFPASDKTDFTNIKDDLKTKITELFYNYILGTIDYAKYTADFTAYASEVNLDSIVASLA